VARAFDALQARGEVTTAQHIPTRGTSQKDDTGASAERKPYDYVVLTDSGQRRLELGLVEA
jgi:hypothetical protein